MVWLCNKCQNIFDEPSDKHEHDMLYNNNKYITRHCPECLSEDIKSYYTLYEYNYCVYKYKDDVLDVLKSEYPKATDDELESLFANFVQVYN